MADSSAADAHDEGDLDNSPTNDSSGLTFRQACEACRTRKIRCDKQSPCYHCMQAGIPCNKAARQTREKRTRVMVSSQYEEKIDLIDKRLIGVTQILHDLKLNLPSPGIRSITSISSELNPVEPVSVASSSPFADASQSTADIPVAEGESSLVAQSAFADNFLHKVVRNAPVCNSDLDLSQSLDLLHSIVTGFGQRNIITEISYPSAIPTPRPTLGPHKLPPIEITVALIRCAQKNTSVASAWIYDFCPLEYFSDLCLKLYFSKDCSEADYIIVNVGLLQLFLQHSESIVGDRTEHLNYAQLCCSNLETALQNLPLHLPATPNMTSALLLGALHAIHISKPTLSWILSSKASELCHSLGYHRIMPNKTGNVAENMRSKQFLFWSIYFINKSLSLRQGRASVIQDWDIITPMLSIQDSPSPLGATISIWVTTARCQGNIYQSLYSPESISQSDEIRERRVQSILLDLKEMENKTKVIREHHLHRARAKYGDREIDFIILSDDVLHLSLLTLVYRASPPPSGSHSSFVPDCIQAARATLERHQDFLVSFDDSNTSYFENYIHWTLLFAPFTPFIVLFCHVIESWDVEDLDRLHVFLKSIENCPMVSDAASKMHNLFQMLYKVALRYVEYRSAASEGRTQTDRTLNAYLTTLGFSSMDYDSGQEQMDTVNSEQRDALNTQAIMGDNLYPFEDMGENGEIHPTMWIGHTTELGEWFNGNHRMMELLERQGLGFLNQNP